MADDERPDLATTLIDLQEDGEDHVRNTLAKLGFDSRVQIGAWYGHAGGRQARGAAGRERLERGPALRRGHAPRTL